MWIGTFLFGASPSKKDELSDEPPTDLHDRNSQSPIWGGHVAIELTPLPAPPRLCVGGSDFLHSSLELMGNLTARTVMCNN